MKVFYLSDVHNEAYNVYTKDRVSDNFLTQLNVPQDVMAESILVIAGDLNSKGRTVRDLEEVASNWKAIVCVLGNHDWWGLSLDQKYKSETKYNNIHILDNDWVNIGGVIFCGSTLWHPVSHLDEHAWRFTMVDAQKVRGRNWSRLRGWEIDDKHSKSLQFIKDCRKIKAEVKILVTHHLLCDQSLDPRFEGHSSNKYYSCDRPDLLEGFTHHVHGHVHCESDYMVNKCNVLCNPRGYPSEIQGAFQVCYFDTEDKK